jgi:ClpP class serine protease
MFKKQDPERAFFQREAQLIRAARELMEVYGSQAAAVAEKRALRLDECGEIATAMTWREIADAVRTIEAKDSPRRSGRSS